MKPSPKQSQIGLFNDQGPSPEIVCRALGHSQKPSPSNDTLQFAHPRVPGRCVKELKYFTGNVAVKVGPVEIEHAPRMIFILVDGRMAYTFSREHAVAMDKFLEHFQLDEPEQTGGAA